VRLSLSLALASALVVASCGVSRDADTAAVSDTGSTTTSSGAQASTTLPAGPDTTAASDEVAATVVFADGTQGEVLHGALNEIAVPTRASSEFIALAYGGTVPPGFEAALLNQSVLGMVLDNELDKVKSAPSQENLDSAKSLLLEQLAPLLTASADPTADAERLFGEVPYLPFIVALQARQIALSNYLKARAPAGEGNPCVRHILVKTEAEAKQLQTDLAGGADFATLAAERSIDPGSGANGGELGCADPSNYVKEFADAVTAAPLGQIVGPIKSEFGFHVLIVDGLEADGNKLAQDRLREGLSSATITVDKRIGTWDDQQLMILAAGG
jgi:hypothetical protein